MKLTTARVLLGAGAAGALGVLASLWWGGSPLLRRDTGQRALQAAMEASAPEPPPGVKPARPGEPMPTNVSCSGVIALTNSGYCRGNGATRPYAIASRKARSFLGTLLSRGSAISASAAGL